MSTKKRIKKLSAGVTYRYMVTKSNGNDSSTYIKGEGEVIGITSFVTKPQGVKIKAQLNDAESVKLSWDNKNTASYYIVYRYKNDTSTVKDNKGINTVERIGVSRTNSYIDKDTEYNYHYWYYVVAASVLDEQRIYSEKSNLADVYMPEAENMSLPDVSGERKTYAYYTAVTAKSSPQYKLLNGITYDVHTDEETGIRMVGDCYCAALGSFYGSEMGTRYRITLEDGKQFKIILCDQKADRHTDKNNQYAVRNKDIVEFYVDKHKIPSQVRGSYNSLDQFNGAIVKIEKLGEVEDAE